MTRRDAILATVAGLSAGAAITSTLQAEELSPPTNPELNDVRALLGAHDKAMTDHNIDGVLATMTERAVLLGTGPGEVWAGPEELKVAYENFFKTFDKGEQKFEYQFREGGLGTDMGWLVTAGNVTGKKEGKDFAFPLNISLSVITKDGNWKIASMHYSTISGAESQ